MANKYANREQYTPMMQQYLSIKDQYKDTLLFFRLGDFYELFFDDALTASKMLEITLTSRSAGANEKIPMCGVPYHAAHSYIQKLVDLGEKIAIAEQTSEPEKGKTLVTREVTKIITPGTFVQEGMFEANDMCYVVSVASVNNTFELCYGDISIGKFYYLKNLQTMDELIDYLRIIQPLEIIMEAAQKEKFAMITERFPQINSYVEAITLTTIANVPTPAIPIFSLLETYLLSVRPDSMNSFQEVLEVEYESSMYMSAATVASLELFETTKTRSKDGSLLALLDLTKTAVGARMLRNWIAHPLLQQESLQQRLNVVEEFYHDFTLRVQVQQILAKTYDLERLISRISSQTAGPRELHQLKLTLIALEELKAFIHNGRFSEQIQNRWQTVGSYDVVLQELIAALATEDINSLNDTGLFNPGYCPELDELTMIANGGTQWLLDLEQRERERTGIKNLRVKYNKVFGYFIEISKGNAQLVQAEWGYERKQTLTNAERFITEELKVKEEQILGSKEKLTQLEKRLFFELCDKITPYRIELQKLADFVAWLDVLQAFAHVSQEFGYVRPTTHTDQAIELLASRHPIVEQVVGKNFIANDVTMIQDDMLLITGPNMAGKSTYMRQIALCAVMHQIGCFVPASQANLPIFDAIYTRIGAQDDLFSGESTFMVEMKEVAHALVHATDKSLLLFDEIGRGTATYDGLALAYAIFKYINEHVHAKTLFSTHYHELTEFTMNMPAVRNIHVSASLIDDNIIFHHHIEEGSVERSYGVQVAKLAQIPLEVIEHAKQILLTLESTTTTVDHTMVNDEQIDAITKIHNQLLTAQEQEALYKNTLVELASISMDDISPRDAFNLLETLKEQAIGILKK